MFGKGMQFPQRLKMDEEKQKSRRVPSAFLHGITEASDR
jgi:hypothetical protein